MSIDSSNALDTTIDTTVPWDTALETLFKCGSADEVANLLRLAGVKGKVGKPDDCPIARYMRQRTGHRTSVSTSLVLDLVVPMRHRRATPAIYDFVVGFDVENHYPDLIDRGA